MRPSRSRHPAQQHIPVDAGLTIRLVESERASGSRVRQGDYVHAADWGIAIGAQSRAARDHLCLVPVHVGPVLVLQFLAQRQGVGPVTVVAEELHANSLDEVTQYRGPLLLTGEVSGLPGDLSGFDSACRVARRRASR